MQLQIPLRTWLALFGLGVALYLVGPLLAIAGSVVILLFLTALLTLLIYPLAENLERRGIQRGLTVAGVLLLVVALFSYLAFQIAPLLTTSLASLSQLVGSLAPQTEDWLDSTLGINIGESGASLIGFISTVLQRAGGMVGNLAARAGAVFWLLFVMIVLVFTLVGNSDVRYWLLHFFVPERFHPPVVVLTGKVSNGLARWFAAQLSISGYYIICYGIVNTILGIPFGMPIAIIAGLVEFVPYLGGIIGLVLSALAAATISTETVIWIVVTNTIIGSLAVYFVSPFFYSRAINVPVAAILFGLYVGGQFGGFIAALLTVPVVTIITILVRELRPIAPPPSETQENEESTQPVRDPQAP